LLKQLPYLCFYIFFLLSFEKESNKENLLLFFIHCSAMDEKRLKVFLRKFFSKKTANLKNH